VKYAKFYTLSSKNPFNSPCIKMLVTRLGIAYGNHLGCAINSDSIPNGRLCAREKAGITVKRHGRRTAIRP
jgi:hypothetical protein